MSAGEMDRLMAFDAPVRYPNEAGGMRAGWNEAFRAWCKVTYLRGGEGDQAGGEAVEASFKIKLRASAGSRALTGAYSMRDPRTGQRFNLRQIDALSDRAYVWIVAEAGVAT